LKKGLEKEIGPENGDAKKKVSSISGKTIKTYWEFGM